MINFDATTEEYDTISKIAERAAPDGEGLIDLQMDLTATHLNGCPLRLDDLLTADEFNFWHDINGIRRHIDRDTGQITNGFLPRFSR